MKVHLLMFKVFRYIKERLRWILSGYKTRTKEEVAEIFQICVDCSLFDNYEDGTGTCTVCGCSIKLDHKDTSFNKLSWATTKCPKGNW